MLLRRSLPQIKLYHGNADANCKEKYCLRRDRNLGYSILPSFIVRSLIYSFLYSFIPSLLTWWYMLTCFPTGQVGEDEKDREEVEKEGMEGWPP